MEEYHAKADHAMEELLNTLETLLDAAGRPDWEVDYHVCVCWLFPNYLNWLLYHEPSYLVMDFPRAACSPSNSARVVHMSSISNPRTSRYGYRLLKGTKFLQYLIFVKRS